MDGISNTVHPLGSSHPSDRGWAAKIRRVATGVFLFRHRLALLGGEGGRPWRERDRACSHARSRVQSARFPRRRAVLAEPIDSVLVSYSVSDQRLRARTTEAMAVLVTSPSDHSLLFPWLVDLFLYLRGLLWRTPTDCSWHKLSTRARHAAYHYSLIRNQLQLPPLSC